VSAIRYLFDEDFNGRAIRGVRRRSPRADTLTVVEARLDGSSDAQVLAWAAKHERTVVSHDVGTMRAEAEGRLMSGQRMSGLVLAHQEIPIGKLINDLVLILEVLSGAEIDGKILFLPL
jgi:hypothetical protein